MHTFVLDLPKAAQYRLRPSYFGDAASKVSHIKVRHVRLDLHYTNPSCSASACTFP